MGIGGGVWMVERNGAALSRTPANDQKYAVM